MNLWYNLILALSLLMGSPLIILSLVQAKRRATMAHRLGLTLNSRAKKQSIGGRRQHADKPIWIHALSVGEVLSAQPIVDALAIRLPHKPLVFSASTMTGIGMAKRLFGTKTRLVFYFPYDLIFSVVKVVNHIDPCLLIIVETDIWPNILHQVKKRGIPIVLANARLSRRSFRGYRFLGRFSQQLLGHLDRVGVQSRGDAMRFADLGMPKTRIAVTGNVKFDQQELDPTGTYGRDLRGVLGFDQGAAIILAGSTHGGEEDYLLDAYGKLKPDNKDLKLILVPRDPGRAQGLLRRCGEMRYGAGLLSGLDRACPDAAKEVLIVNTIGILRNLYALSDIAFIGGSMVSEGGHNPLEAAVFGRAIVFGPHMSDFKAIVEELQRCQAALCVSNQEQLTDTLSGLLADGERRMAMGQRARQIHLSNKGATNRTLELITALVS